MTGFNLSRRLVAEGLGTAILLAAIVGSGIMAERLSGGSEALALLANMAATGAILAVLILIFGPISGAHFNPAVSLVFYLRREITKSQGLAYVAVQLAGGLVGVALAHGMFGEPIIQAAVKARHEPGMWLGEVIATAGLAMTILGCVRWRPSATPYAVGLFISAGYWFTSSTSFANPAVTVARSFTDSFTGIRLADAPAFIAAQLIGAVLAALLFRWLEKGELES
ncbi:MAG: MIP/aquaporin family protein [Alphaproteobacteria bacterium]|jgi:glycerol uptake facilitator-like aquaporin